MKPKVSVVVPVYNAEPYLRTCLESLRDQSLRDLEVIVVLDLPTDGSARIAMEFADDARFRIIQHQRNKGSSAARNTGMASSDGEFLGFVDSDDFVDPQMFESMVAIADEARADIVSCAYRRVDQDGQLVSTHPFPLGSGAPRDHPELVADLQEAHSTTLLWFACRNIYRRSMIDGHGLTFDERLRSGEDPVFNLRAFYYAARWAGAPDASYSYRASPAGLTMSPWVAHLVTDLSLAYQLKMAAIDEFGLGEQAREDARLYTVRNLLPRLVGNALSTPVKADRKRLLDEVVRLPMITESLRSVGVWDRRLPRGVRVMAALAKSRRTTALMAYGLARRRS